MVPDEFFVNVWEGAREPELVWCRDFATAADDVVNGGAGYAVTLHCLPHGVVRLDLRPLAEAARRDGADQAAEQARLRSWHHARLL